jgi:hypothetical protein
MHLLLSSGADVNLADTQGCTPIAFAAKFEWTRRISIFLGVVSKVDAGSIVSGYVHVLWDALLSSSQSGI